MIGFLVVCVLFSVFPSKVSSSIIGDYTVSASNQICFVAFVCLFVCFCFYRTQWWNLRLSRFPRILPEGIVFRHSLHCRVFFLLTIMTRNKYRKCID